MRCINDRFYTVDGPLPDESKLKRTIYEEILPWLHAKVAQTVEQIIKALKLAAYADPLPLQYDRIHVANGTCFLDGTFTAKKEYCSNRLSVSYRADAPAPEHWLCFLSELLEPEDIPALQEYLGYCLIPSTKGQKMLMLIGKGGEGKSRIGVVMNVIFGLNMNTTSIQKVENSRFARADLEGKLLMVDDDLDMNALTKTNYVKSIVAAGLRMDLERKKKQSYQGQLYVRFLCFGNGALTALHDRSDGFFHRPIILTTKGKKVLRTSYSVLQDDFFNYMKAAGYTDVERGERGSTEEHLTVTQFKVAQEQQRLEDMTAQISQTEQALDTAQAAVEKK